MAVQTAFTTKIISQICVRHLVSAAKWVPLVESAALVQLVSAVAQVKFYAHAFDSI